MPPGLACWHTSLADGWGADSGCVSMSAVDTRGLAVALEAAVVVATASWAPRGGSKGHGVDRTATGAALGCGGRTPLERSTGWNESTSAASASSSAIMASTTASHRRAASITSESTDCDRRRRDVGLGLFIPRVSRANVSAASSALAESAVGAAVANLIPRRRVFNTDRHTQRHAHKTRTRQAWARRMQRPVFDPRPTLARNVDCTALNAMVSPSLASTRALEACKARHEGGSTDICTV